MIDEKECPYCCDEFDSDLAGRVFALIALMVISFLGGAIIGAGLIAWLHVF